MCTNKHGCGSISGKVKVLTKSQKIKVLEILKVSI